MKAQRFAWLATLLALAACGEAQKIDRQAGNASAADVAEANAITGPGTVPVRIGELGANFPACNAVGTTRRLAEGAMLEVRAAPFADGKVVNMVPNGGRFFVCARSHDQRWFGIVWQADEAAGACGVSTPVPARRAYEGPCESGWVASANVALVAG